MTATTPPPAAPGPAHEGFLAPAFFQDPYPVYRTLVEKSPIFWSRAIGAWVVCPFETVKQGLSDPRLVATGRIAAAASHFTAAERAELPTVMRMLDHWMNFQDPPMHTRIRRLVSKAFTPQTVAALEPKIERLVAELLDRAVAEAPFDLVQAFSFQLPALVICELLGVPPERRDDLRAWSEGLARFTSSAQVSLADARHAERAALDSKAYLEGMLVALRAEPADNLLTRLARGAPEEGMSDEDIAALAMNLFFAGFETTEGLIGNLVTALVANPDQLDLLRRRPELAAAAVEEALRYDSSVQKQSRVAAEDVEILGQTIRRGDYVHFVIGAANRDPARFARPDAFDIDRADAANVSFGHGIHFCLGAPLARLEARIAIVRLLERMPALAIRPPGPRYPELFAIRKPLSLVVAPA